MYLSAARGGPPVRDNMQPMIAGGMKKRKAPKKKKGMAGVRQDIQKIKKELALQEVKNFDGTLLTPRLVGWDYGAVYNLFACGQGDTQNTRDGDKCFVKNMDLRYAVRNSSASFLGVVRVVVWIDEDNTLAGTNLFASAGFNGTTNAPYAFYNRQYRPQVKILYDEIHDLDLTSDSQDSVRVNIPVNTLVTYQPASTAIQQNALKILFISNNAEVGSSITANYYARIYFTD